MHYALPLRHERDRMLVGADVLVLNVDPPHVYAFLHGRPRLIVRIGEKGQPVLQARWSCDRIGELVLIALTKLSAPQFADRAAQFYAETTHRCARCRRRITNPQSVRRGLGPECAEKGGRVL